MSIRLRIALIELARDNPEFRAYLIPVLRKTAMTFRTDDALKKYLKKHPGADKSKHKVEKTKSKKHDREREREHDATPSVYSEKHKIHLKGVFPEDLDHFLDSDIGKELLTSYKLKIVAGRDSILTKSDLERATNILTKMRDASVKKSLKGKNVCVDPSLAPGWKDICAENLGVERASMPQFTTKPVKTMLAGMTTERHAEIKKLYRGGQGDTVPREEMERYYDRDNAGIAVAAGADPESTESTFDTFVRQLRKEGVEVTDKTEKGIRVGDLAATQSEIQANKVFENAETHLRGEEESTGPVYVTSDGHILDGHHRWAGILTADPDAHIPAIVIDMPMKEMLRRSHESPGVFRQNIAFDVVNHDEPLDLGFEPGETWQQRGKWYAKGPEKDAASSGPFENKAAADVHAKGKKSKGKKASRDEERLALERLWG